MEIPYYHLHNQPSFIDHISNFGSINLQKNHTGEGDMRDLLRDALRLGLQNLEDSSGGKKVVRMVDESIFTDLVHVEELVHSSNNKITWFHNLLKDYDQELYPDVRIF